MKGAPARSGMASMATATAKADLTLRATGVTAPLGSTVHESSATDLTGIEVVAARTPGGTVLPEIRASNATGAPALASQTARTAAMREETPRLGSVPPVVDLRMSARAEADVLEGVGRRRPR
jgi:hypothetical protein